MFLRSSLCITLWLLPPRDEHGVFHLLTGRAAARCLITKNTAITRRDRPRSRLPFDPGMRFLFSRSSSHLIIGSPFLDSPAALCGSGRVLFCQSRFIKIIAYMRQKVKGYPADFSLWKTPYGPVWFLRLGALLFRAFALQEGEEEGSVRWAGGKARAYRVAAARGTLRRVCGAAGGSCPIRPAAGSGTPPVPVHLQLSAAGQVSILPFPAELGRASSTACSDSVGHVRRGPAFRSSWCIEAASPPPLSI